MQNSNGLMLLREIIIVYSEDHTKRKHKWYAYPVRVIGRAKLKLNLVVPIAVFCSPHSPADSVGHLGLHAFWGVDLNCEDRITFSLRTFLEFDIKF